MENDIVSNNSQKKNYKPEGNGFNFKMDFLKIEVDFIDKSISRLDNMSKSTKHWAILLWAGSIALALGENDLRKYIIVSSLIPILFWFVDSWWAYLRLRYVNRSFEISGFLNSNRLEISFKENRLKDFQIFDPSGSRGRSQKTFSDKIKTFFLRVIWYPEFSFFYLGLFVVSLFLGFYFNFCL
jgi:hypothetical protein